MIKPRYRDFVFPEDDIKLADLSAQSTKNFDEWRHLMIKRKEFEEKQETEFMEAYDKLLDENQKEADRITDEMTELNRTFKERYQNSFSDNPNRLFEVVKKVIKEYTIEDCQKDCDFYNETLERTEKMWAIKKDKPTFKRPTPHKVGYTYCKQHLSGVLLNEYYIALSYNLDTSIIDKMVNKKARELFPVKERKKPEILPNDEFNKVFSRIYQGNTTNSLARVKPMSCEIDQMNGTATFKQGDMILSIPNYKELMGLKNSTKQMLDIININLTESGAKSPEVTFSLEEYMQRRGLKDVKEARKQAKNDLELLRTASIKFEESDRRRTNNYKFVNIADSGGIKNGQITFRFGDTFFQLLKGYCVMNYPNQLARVNNQKNPNGYALGRKIAEHKNMNAGKPNEDIISVNTLLSASQLPTYEEVAENDRHFTARIITPFERDLDALSDMFKWEYCHTNGKPLSNAELNTMDYDLFKTLNIHILWNEYPDQTERLKRKAEKIEKAKSTKARKTKKE